MNMTFQKDICLGFVVLILVWSHGVKGQTLENPWNQPRDEWPATEPPPSPYIIYGPHGYRTFPHSRCQEVPTADVSLSELKGNWSLVEYMASFDGKPVPPHNPYLCPESRMVWSPNANMDGMNISQISIEWPQIYKDVVQWTQHHNKSGVFFHEENIFSLWTMKIMEVVPDSHMLVFFCIDYTIWPGWNHRGIYILKRDPLSYTRVRRRLSRAAHRRMRIQYHRTVNTTTCDPDDFLNVSRERWHPHRLINPISVRAHIHPWMSRQHRRNLKHLD